MVLDPIKALVTRSGTRRSRTYSQSLRGWLSAIFVVATLVSLFAPAWVSAEPQDPPAFTTHELPTDDRPAPRAPVMSLVDMSVLFFALSLGAYLILKKRTRRGIFWLSLFSLGYFGFFRKGCVCPIGSIQNVTEGLFNSAYVVPIVVVFFFVLPLVFAALFGRTYCAAVCPHGALQDAVLMKPIEVPKWLDHGLGLIPFIYLGLGVLFSATGTAYVICDYDPFIALFRRTGSTNMLALGAMFMIAGVFVGRPYCRYMCPYGVLLRLFSHVSKWQVKIYPDRCIDCQLCDDSCPFGAIDKTTPRIMPETARDGKRRLTAALVAAPILIAVCAWGGSKLGMPFSGFNETVRVAYQVEAEELALAKGATLDQITRTEYSESWRNLAEETPDQLFARAGVVQSRMSIGATLFGVWVALVISVKWISLCLRRKRPDYEANRGNCYSCGRCYDYCPGSEGAPDPFVTAVGVRGTGANG